MFIIAPPGDVIGFIEEEFSLFSTELILRNSAAEALYRISIPKHHKFYMPKEHTFRVMSGDGLTQKGSIVRKWSTDTNLYTTNVYFTDPDLNVRLKSLYIGAAFLLVRHFFCGQNFNVKTCVLFMISGIHVLPIVSGPMLITCINYYAFRRINFYFIGSSVENSFIFLRRFIVNNTELFYFYTEHLN